MVYVGIYRMTYKTMDEMNYYNEMKNYVSDINIFKQNFILLFPGGHAKIL